jgi:hypothetical protein
MFWFALQHKFIAEHKEKAVPITQVPERGAEDVRGADGTFSPASKRRRFESRCPGFTAT